VSKRSADDSSGIGLVGRRILVGGGTGDVGIEIVAKLIAAGAEVVVPARDPHKAELLRRHVGDDDRHRDALTIIDGFPEDDAQLDAIASQLAAVAPFDGAVATLGPWFHGPALVSLPLMDWHRVLRASLDSHFLFAKLALPALREGGQYVMLNGAAAEQPVPHAGVVSIAARAQTMLSEVIAAEHPHIGVHTLMLRSVIATRARRQIDPRWVTAAAVGDAVTWLFGEQGRRTAGSTLTLNALTFNPKAD
jgi:NAD(P)-dependent dehydrogenase (short-subunit alcohol dehydrogenase family)